MVFPTGSFDMRPAKLCSRRPSALARAKYTSCDPKGTPVTDCQRTAKVKLGI